VCSSKNKGKLVGLAKSLLKLVEKLEAADGGGLNKTEVDSKTQTTISEGIYLLILRSFCFKTTSRFAEKLLNICEDAECPTFCPSRVNIFRL
jgi:hypothetical protein